MHTNAGKVVISVLVKIPMPSASVRAIAQASAQADGMQGTRRLYLTTQFGVDLDKARQLRDDIQSANPDLSIVGEWTLTETL